MEVVLVYLLFFVVFFHCEGNGYSNKKCTLTCFHCTIGEDKMPQGMKTCEGKYSLIQSCKIRNEYITTLNCSNDMTGIRTGDVCRVDDFVKDEICGVCYCENGNKCHSGKWWLDKARGVRDGRWSLKGGNWG